MSHSPKEYVMTSLHSKPLALKNVTVTDSFWRTEQELVRTAVIPYQWNALNDNVPGAAPSYCMHNFKAAAAQNKRKDTQGKAFVPPKYTFRGFEALPRRPGQSRPRQVLRLRVPRHRLLQVGGGSRLFPRPLPGPRTGTDRRPSHRRRVCRPTRQRLSGHLLHSERHGSRVHQSA
jgi:hypothetical protein